MLSDADIVRMIMEFAARCGDPTPGTIRYVRGCRADLNRLFGAEIGGDNGAIPAVPVEATGDFIWPRAVGLVPRRPIGRVITMVINEAISRPVDAGISPEPARPLRAGEIHRVA